MRRRLFFFSTLADFKKIKPTVLQDQKRQLFSTDNNKSQKKAVVSGKSITGMMSALTLAKNGYYVDIYDQRDSYSRNIQWAGRQSLIDALASVDEKLYKKFISEIAQPLENGSIHLGADGSRKISKREEVKIADPNRIPKTGEEMIAEKSIVTMEAKRFEAMLNGYLHTIPNIKQHKGSIELLEPDADGNYKVLNHGTPSLIVIAEGANSKTRDKLGIESVLTSSSKLQIAGVIYLDSGGKMVKHWRNEDGEIRLTGTMGTKKAGKTWIVADIDNEKITPAQKYAFDQRFFKDKKQELIRKEFRRLAKDALELPEHIINSANIDGAIAGQDVAVFNLQQKLSNTATHGNNIILSGDAVGNNHWSVGGGMQIGAVSHNERLKYFIEKEKQINTSDKDEKKLALNQYSNGALNDTMAWGKVAMQDCYPKLNKYYARDLYVKSVKDWRDKNAKTPLDSINEGLSFKTS
jgi:2-polyprenyl-6-methoxyphenol hydroxylase-like FAD-dependent oxidoreductase